MSSSSIPIPLSSATPTSSSSSSSSRPVRLSANAARTRIAAQSMQEQRRDERQRAIENNVHRIKRRDKRLNDDTNEDDYDEMNVDMDMDMDADEFSDSNADDSDEEDGDSEEENQQHESHATEEEHSSNQVDHPGVKKRSRSSTEASDQPLQKKPKASPAFNRHENQAAMMNEEDESSDEEWDGYESRNSVSQSASKRRKHPVIKRNDCFDRIDAARTAEERIQAVINEIFVIQPTQPGKRNKKELVPDIKDKINLQSPRTGLTLLMAYAEATRVDTKLNHSYHRLVLKLCKVRNINLNLKTKQGETLGQFITSANTSGRRGYMNSFEIRVYKKFFLFSRRNEFLYQRNAFGLFPIHTVLRSFVSDVHHSTKGGQLIQFLIRIRLETAEETKDENGNTWVHTILLNHPASAINHVSSVLMDINTFPQPTLELTNNDGSSVFDLLMRLYERSYTMFMPHQYYRYPYPAAHKTLVKYQVERLLPTLDVAMNTHMINDLVQICLNMLVGESSHQLYLTSKKEIANSVAAAAASPTAKQEPIDETIATINPVALELAPTSVNYPI